MRIVVALVLSALVLGLPALNGFAADDGVAQDGKQTLCPIMRGKINKDLYADVEGKRIYVCCASCIDRIKSNPGKYIEKLEKQGITLDKTP